MTPNFIYCYWSLTAMKIVMSTFCGEILARKEETTFPLLLKILSQHAEVAGIPKTLRATTESRGNCFS